MKKGWFVGHFDPSVYETNNAEVAVKKYIKGSCENWHFRKIAIEITVIVSGKVKMNGPVDKKSDIIVIKLGEGTDFNILENTITIVIIISGANNGKYF